MMLTLPQAANVIWTMDGRTARRASLSARVYTDRTSVLTGSVSAGAGNTMLRRQQLAGLFVLAASQQGADARHTRSVSAGQIIRCLPLFM